MENNYEFLVEQEEIWAKMFTQILEDQGVPYTAMPVYGAGMVLRAGVQERFKIYVPSNRKEEAEELLRGFSQGEENL